MEKTVDLSPYAPSATIGRLKMKKTFTEKCIEDSESVLRMRETDKTRIAAIIKDSIIKFLTDDIGQTPDDISISLPKIEDYDDFIVTLKPPRCTFVRFRMAYGSDRLVLRGDFFYGTVRHIGDRNIITYTESEKSVRNAIAQAHKEWLKW